MLMNNVAFFTSCAVTIYFVTSLGPSPVFVLLTPNVEKEIDPTWLTRAL